MRVEYWVFLVVFGVVFVALLVWGFSGALRPRPEDRLFHQWFHSGLGQAREAAAKNTRNKASLRQRMRKLGQWLAKSGRSLHKGLSARFEGLGGDKTSSGKTSSGKTFTALHRLGSWLSGLAAWLRYAILAAWRRVQVFLYLLVFLLFVPMVVDRLFNTTLAVVGIANQCPDPASENAKPADGALQTRPAQPPAPKVVKKGADQEKAGQDKAGQDKAGQDKAGQEKAGQHNKAGPSALAALPPSPAGSSRSMGEKVPPANQENAAKEASAAGASIFRWRWVQDSGEKILSELRYIVIGNTPCIRPNSLQSAGEKTGEPTKAAERSAQFHSFGLGQIVIYNKDKHEDSEKPVLRTRIFILVAGILFSLGLVWPLGTIFFLQAVFLAGIALGIMSAAWRSVAAVSPMAFLLVPMAGFTTELCSRLLFRLRSQAHAEANGDFDYAGPDWRHARSRADDLPRPVPGQRGTIDRLLELCDIVIKPEEKGKQQRSSSRVGLGKLVLLFGRRGQGKSLVLEWFARKAKNYGHAVVVVNVWSLEAEPDLESAIMRIIAHDWDIAERGWLHYPASWITFARFIGGIKLRFKVFGNDMEVAHPLAKAPRVLWRGTLQRMVAATVAVGARRFSGPRRRVVVVLDDVDRCSPLVSQQLITLAKRFLNVPDLTVVLSCDEKILRTRVFDPVNALLPDLAAVVEDELIMRYADPPELLRSVAADAYRNQLYRQANVAFQAFRMPGGEGAPVPDQASVVATPSGAGQSGGSKTVLSVDKTGTEAVLSLSEIAQPYREARRQLMLLSYLSDTEGLQASLRGRISNKYLTETAVEVGILSAIDVQTLLVHNGAWQEFQEALRQCMKLAEQRAFDQFYKKEFLDPVEQGGEPSAYVVEAILKSRNKNNQTPWAALFTLREFVGALNREMVKATGNLDTYRGELSSDQAKGLLAGVLQTIVQLTLVHGY